MTEPIRPPAHIEAYINIMGVDRALDFFLAFGGSELYIPKSCLATHRIVQVIGGDAAQRLGVASSRMPKRVPMPKKYIAQVLQQQGLTVADTARKLHVSDTTVRSYLKDGPKRAAPDLQPDLFD